MKIESERKKAAFVFCAHVPTADYVVCDISVSTFWSIFQTKVMTPSPARFLTEAILCLIYSLPPSFFFSTTFSFEKTLFSKTVVWLTICQKNRKCLSWQPSKSHFSSKFDRTFQFLCFFPALVHPETCVDPFPVEKEAPFGGIRSDSTDFLGSRLYRRRKLNYKCRRTYHHRIGPTTCRLKFFVDFF